MADPLAQIVTLLQPTATFSKVVGAAGRWRVHRVEDRQPFYCVILSGSCRLVTKGQAPLILETDDFVLIPDMCDVVMASLEPPAEEDINSTPVAQLDGGFRLGEQSGPPEVQFLVGHCVFGSPDADLLVSLLPDLVHVRGERSLATLVKLVREESRDARPARDVVLARLLEVLLIDALRSTGTGASAGLLRGLADQRLALALRAMHECPEKNWTVAQLAHAAALSRSAFFTRFSRAVGIAPMAYLLSWRMALAKNLLRRNEHGVAEIAERVGYRSASAFSVAFARHVGMPPTEYVNRSASSVRR